MGTSKHRTSGYATKSPKMRMHEKLQAEREKKISKDDVKYYSSIKDLMSSKIKRQG